jgi:hypothetical protein
VAVAAALLCSVAILAVAAAPGFAAGVNSSKSFSELASGGSGGEEVTQTKTATTATTSATRSESTTNSQTLILVAIGAAVVLLAGIAVVIVRDARRVAPAVDGDVAEVQGGHNPGAMAKRRAKAKAARRQRKRNR